MNIMPTAIDPRSIPRARRLRRDMTEGERKLWSELREFRRLYGVHVRRQAPVGPYVADFAIHERRLIVEVDGQHHFEPEGLERDRQRDEWFASQGYRVLRISTGELSDAFDGCVEEILRELGLMERDPTPDLSSRGRAGSGGTP
jgi:very-short-patch-repair endonuclease